jgi:hypothetical protein
MSLFLLFGGPRYYPHGGWDDFAFAGTLEECKAKLASWDDFLFTADFEDGLLAQWLHIVDFSTRRKVLVAEQDNDEKEVVWRTPDEFD